MDETTTLRLMSHLVGQIINHYDSEGNINVEQRKQFSDKVAEAAWEGLVVMMRQSFAASESVVLEHVGRFEKRGEQWIFSPAASLAEADAVSLPPQEGREQLANHALFYLEQGEEILERIPRDVEIRLKVRVGEEVIRAAAGYGIESPRLSEAIRRVALRLGRIANRLTGEDPARGRVLFEPLGGHMRAQMFPRYEVKERGERAEELEERNLGTAEP